MRKPQHKIPNSHLLLQNPQLFPNFRKGFDGFI
jgi:hypothetical protein